VVVAGTFGDTVKKAMFVEVEIPTSGLQEVNKL